MNSNGLLDIIGETPERYVLDTAIASNGNDKNRLHKKRRTVSKILLIAALIGLLSATVATAAELLRIWIRHEDSFTNLVPEEPSTNCTEIDVSKNGVIEFRIDIEEEISGEPVPVLEVVPHFLTEEDVKRVAYVLFPDGVFYEAEPAFEEKNSKMEIQEKIDRWSYYTTEEALRELYNYRPNQTGYLPGIAKNVQNFVDNYSHMLDGASSTNLHKLCDWTFKKNSVYELTASELASQDTSKDNNAIKADIKAGDVYYRFSASVRDKDDFLISNISVYPYDGIGPDMIDERIFRTWLCRTEEPTEKQIAAVKEKAEIMLQQMQLGNWMIDECFVETEEINEYKNYIIHVNAVPVLNGVPALRKAQPTNLRCEKPGAARYYYTDVQFEFSANGDLVSFKMKSPIEIQNEVTTSMAALKIEEQLEIAKEYLSQKDFYFYSTGYYFDDMGESAGCVVDINGLEYNLTRINGENPLESYYYVPGIKLTGDVRYYDLESGDVYLERQDVTLVIIDAENGTVVVTP